MTTAVLKNTLLMLTDREFSESTYGFGSFNSLIRSLDDLVTLEGTRAPFTVKLVTPPSASAPSESSARVARHRPSSNTELEHLQVREDLWRAALDYTRPGGYWWLGGKAVRSESDSPPADGIRIPQITREELNEARKRFGDTFLTPEETARWITDARGSIKALPAKRAEWAIELKRLVVDHLTVWFEKSPDLNPPDDLFVTNLSGRRPSRTLVVTEPPSVGKDASSLLALVLDVVRAMTEDELKALQLPASAVSRAHLR
ncbi:hypothetical protein HQ314_15565 [Rhodococcus sp. BP-332]|uniref:hypothetical protein n=1 Tax=Rhodococcus sp. BP-332 TaxID=2739447 RepID=UPI001C9A3E88|nr:hypothetical protein [Rhodococcus sp. BP-332]MBY6678341.1 hypothetical protein [Rhodococcus sp. BP-332]